MGLHVVEVVVHIKGREAVGNGRRRLQQVIVVAELVVEVVELVLVTRRRGQQADMLVVEVVGLVLLVQLEVEVDVLGVEVGVLVLVATLVGEENALVELLVELVLDMVVEVVELVLGKQRRGQQVHMLVVEVAELGLLAQLGVVVDVLGEEVVVLVLVVQLGGEENALVVEVVELVLVLHRRGQQQGDTGQNLIKLLIHRQWVDGQRRDSIRLNHTGQQLFTASTG